MSEGDATGPMRLQKFLSRAGVASRREAERLILQGRVRVDGVVVTELGTQVPHDAQQVEVDGRRVGTSTERWIVFHKPAGTLTTRTDPGGRPTVYDALPPDFESLRYLGRLDRDTEGLLILSNAGDLMHQLQHPSGEVEREYEVQVVGVPDAETLRRLRQGVELEDGPARVRDVKVLRTLGPGCELRLVLMEGRKREVRRLLEAVGHPVRRLTRVRFGPIRLGSLALGAWRDLTERELRELAATVAPA